MLRSAVKEILSETKSLNALLSKTKYGIDYYQREYVWEQQHVLQLIEDLADNFMKNYRPSHERQDVKNYDLYFLGTIIISNVDNHQLVVDGQQRLTTLTFLLISLLKFGNFPETQKSDIQHLVYSDSFGKLSYNLDVPERISCMEHLSRGTTLDTADITVPLSNMLARYADIEDNVPDQLLTTEILPLFIDWLLHRVLFVKITAYSHADAYTMFESMNDRGVQLTHSELLRGYLLSRIRLGDQRQKASRAWSRRVDELDSVRRGELPYAIRGWLRAKRAKTIGEYESIGNDFNRWVRDNEDELGLHDGSDFFELISNDFDFYAHWYGLVRRIASDPKEAVERKMPAIRYNWVNDFTLQTPALLAPLDVNDSEEDILRKLRVVSVYVDCMLMRRVWNGSAIFERYMRSRIFNGLVTMMRGKTVDELVDMLTSRLVEYPEQFVPNYFGVHQQNRKRVKYLLARFNDAIETEIGGPSLFEKYMSQAGSDPFEVEHIWAFNYDHVALGFSHEYEFYQYRDRIGGLLLLPKSFNASYGSRPYEVKYEHYFGQNILAKSLHKNAYVHHSRFSEFIARSGLPFGPHVEFNPEDLDQRQELYRQMASYIWAPETIRHAAE